MKCFLARLQCPSLTLLPASILYTMHSWCTLLDWPICQSSSTSWSGNCGDELSVLLNFHPAFNFSFLLQLYYTFKISQPPFKSECGRSATFWHCAILWLLSLQRFSPKYRTFHRKFISSSLLSRSSKKGGLRSHTPEKAAVKTETVCK